MRYSRQNKIIEIISNNEVDTQEKLAAMLRESGFEVTQATISRDIKELQLEQFQGSPCVGQICQNLQTDCYICRSFRKYYYNQNPFRLCQCSR